jgi:RloB-like protein
MSRKPRKPTDLIKRKVSQKGPYDRVLIVCEGEKTERIYFKDLINHYRLSTANIEVCSSGGSAPKSVVDHAKKMQQGSTLPTQMRDLISMEYLLIQEERGRVRIPPPAPIYLLHAHGRGGLWYFYPYLHEF